MHVDEVMAMILPLGSLPFRSLAQRSPRGRGTFRELLKRQQAALESFGYLF